MPALASGPVDAGSQAVLLYCWTPDVEGLHDELAAAGVAIGDVTHPSRNYPDRYEHPHSGDSAERPAIEPEVKLLGVARRTEVLRNG